MTHRSSGRYAGPKQSGMRKWLLLGGILLVILVLLGGILLFLSNHPPRPRLTTNPTAIPAPRTTWEVMDPSLDNAVVSYGEYTGSAMPNSDNSCFGMYAKSLVCQIDSPAAGTVTMAGMITFPQLPAVVQEEKLREMSAGSPEYFIEVPCQEGGTDKVFFTLDGIGPASASLRNIGQIPIGEWRYLDRENVCGDGKITRYGWAFYPDDGTERVIYHLWNPAPVISP